MRHVRRGRGGAGRRTVLLGAMLAASLTSSWQSAPAWAQDENRFNCEDFSSQAEAQRELDKDPEGGPNILEADDDGQACDTYPYAEGSGNGEAGGAADRQYGRDDVIDETIVDQKKLSDTGGPPLALFGALALLVTGLFLGRSVMRF